MADWSLERTRASRESACLRVSSRNMHWIARFKSLRNSALARVRSLCPPKLLPEIGGTGAADRRLLLEEILLQLDGEICSILRRIADGSFVKNETAASIQVLAMETAGAPATVHRARVVRKDRHASHLSLTYLLKSIRLSIYN